MRMTSKMALAVEEEDFLGIRHLTTWDPARRLPLARVQAAGRADLAGRFAFDLLQTVAHAVRRDGGQLAVAASGSFRHHHAGRPAL